MELVHLRDSRDHFECLWSEAPSFRFKLSNSQVGINSNMRIILKIPQVSFLLVTFATVAFANAKTDNFLKCYNCEISNSTERVCNFSYQCATNDFCETLISRVDGHDLSIILSCATEEKCLVERSIKSLGDCDYSK